ncbi:unnamed protein product, partial [Discosporangium mesarthrocarpum]
KFRLGQKVEAQYRGGGRWYKGRVVGVNSNGTYDVRYDDGDESKGIVVSSIRPLDAEPSMAPTTRTPRLGDEVEARYRGGSKWHSGKIVRENRDGTYDIHYSDGGTEKGVEPGLVRRSYNNREGERNVGPGARGGARARRGGFRVGEKIEARYRGRTKWFPGTVRRLNSDDTYDIRYEDGDEECGVGPSLIRQAETRASTSENRGGSDEEDPRSGGAGHYEEGDKVEARFGGRSRWFKATVQRKNRDGTYYLCYEDGDEEKAVEKDLIRNIGGGSEGVRSAGGRRRGSGHGLDSESWQRRWEVDDHVEARYRGGGRWYPGVIRSVNRDGTYEIRYSDGDTEHSVEKGFIRGKGGASTESLSSDNMGGSFQEGDKVEARFGGRSRWFKATVQRKNRDGTYYLRYEDGDEEKAVEKDLIRKI